MKPGTQTRILNLALLAVGLLALQEAAGAFSYTNCELIAAFRVPTGVSDLVVNLGPSASFEGLPARTALTITNVSPDQLHAVFPSLNGLAWSVSGARRGNTNYPQFPLQTTWVTAPQAQIGSSGPTWLRKGQFTLGTTSGQIDAIGAGAIVYGTLQPAGPNNTSTAIVIPSTDPNSYSTVIGVDGDFAGSFQGDVENTTADDFDSTGSSSRSILYELQPASGSDLNTPGQVLGFFDLKPEGTLTFTAGTPPESTTITSIQSNGAGVTISFPTTKSVSYRLRSTDAVGLFTPISAWNLTGNSVSGNGSLQSIKDTNTTSAVRFYVVEAF
jgi:hypothetical protein